MQGRPGMPGSGPFVGGGPFGGNIPGRAGMPGGGTPVMAMQQPQQRPQQRPQQSTSTNSTVLLVPEFGEASTDVLRVARFGESAETTSTAATARNVNYNNADSDMQRQINDQAQQMMNRFDRDKNGVIEKATGEWNNINFDANAADTNRDGRITLDELRAFVGNQLRGGKSGAKVFTSYATTYEHMPDGIPSWFTDRDKDNDGQLTLFEYANGQPITAEVIAEFEWLDMNNDGIATLAECYVAIKTKEDEERKKQEEESGVPAGNSPRFNPRDRRDGPNIAGGSFTPGADRNAAGGRSVPTRPTPNNTNQRGNPPQGRPGGQPGGYNNQQQWQPQQRGGPGGQGGGRRGG